MLEGSFESYPFSRERASMPRKPLELLSFGVLMIIVAVNLVAALRLCENNPATMVMFQYGRLK